MTANLTATAKNGDTQPPSDPGFEVSLKLHHEIEALYPRIEQGGFRFRALSPTDPGLPHPPGEPSRLVHLDPVVCGLSIKAATTKRAIVALCELGDGDNAIALARVMLENSCLLEWLIRGKGRRRLEAYVMFLSVIHERMVEIFRRHDVRFGRESRLSSDQTHRDVWKHTFWDHKRREPTQSGRPTWDIDPITGKFEPASAKKMFKEIADGKESFEYEALYGALGSDVVHSGPFGLGRIMRDFLEEGLFKLHAVPVRDQCTVALASSNQAMFLVLDSLTEYLGLDLSAELAPLKKRARKDPYRGQRDRPTRKRRRP